MLTRSQEAVDIQPDQRYRQVTVKMWGQGVVLRNEVMGAEIGAPRRQMIRAGQFILSRIDARHGATGIVPEDLDGAVVSNDFPTYNLNTSLVLPKYFNWVSKTHNFVELCKTASEGTTNRIRLQEERFLALTIALPTPDEQSRIVRRIEELAAKIEYARSLRREGVEAAEVLLWAAMNDIWKEHSRWKGKPIEGLAEITSGQVDPRIEPYASLPHISGDSIESGTGKLLPYRLAKEDGVISGKYHFSSGAVLYSKIRPYLRKAVQVPFEGICSADIYAFYKIDEEIDPRFFMYSLITPPFTTYANNISGRTRMPKLNQDQLKAFKMRYPSLSEQQRIVTYLDALQAKIDTAKQLQAETEEEINSILPTVLDRAFKGEL